MNPVILYLRTATRELDIALMKAQIFAGELSQVLRTLRFEPVDWHDTDTFEWDWVIATTKEGHLRIYSTSEKVYVEVYRLHPQEFMHFVFRLLNLLESDVLKLKE
jgi:RPA family protein